MLRRRSPAPAGFTLVELLIVVVIIAILLALLLPATFKAFIIAQEAEAKNEMSQFANAVTTFKNDWGAVPPTVFCLPQRPSGNAGAYGPLQDASFLFLKQRYNRWPATTDGSGNIIYDASMTAFIGQPLQGNQCMVFFLGGPQLTGWAHDRPAAPTDTAVSKSFYLEIKDTKAPMAGSQYGYPSNHRVYLDPFGAAYVYFGSNPSAKGGKYNNLTATTFDDQPAFATAHPDLGATGTVNPYVESATPLKYANENMCQIICAGPDNRFGPGGTNWSPTNADYIGGAVGADDLANFNGGNRLGIR